MKTLQIGNLHLDVPVLSAPMAGLSDRPWRNLLRYIGGAGLIETEMVSARAFVYMGRKGEERPARLSGLESEPGPLSVQIWDNEPESLKRIAAFLVTQNAVSVLDLNFGCPAPQIVRNSASGSYLLRDPARVGKLVHEVVQIAGSTPVTAKIRLGLTLDSINAVDVAQAVEEAGAAALTVHGRTASQMYSGEANWDEIARVKESLKRIPLIGNGDIKTAEEACRCLTDFPVDGIMIGRGALTRPWIFRQIRALLMGEEPIADPSLDGLKEIILTHYRFSVEHYGLPKAVLLMRRFACFYSRSRFGGRAFRTQIARVETEVDFLKIVDEFC